MTAANHRTAQIPIFFTTPSTKVMEGGPFLHPTGGSVHHPQPTQRMTTPRELHWTPKPAMSSKPKTPEEKLCVGGKLNRTREGNQVHKQPQGRARGHCRNRGRGRRKLPLGSVRLVSANDLPDRGRVEIFIGGEWGTVCDDLFTSKAGMVVCRQLGYTTVLAVLKKAVLGEADHSVRILLDDVECEGKERSLLGCKRSRIGKHNCSHKEDVGVICGYDTVEE